MLKDKLTFTHRQRAELDWIFKVTEADQESLRNYLQELLEDKSAITAIELAEAFKFYKDLDIQGMKDQPQLWHPERIKSERIFARESGSTPEY